MGLPSQLIPALVCLLAWTSNFTHGHKHSLTLRETIEMLTILTAKKVSELSGTISPSAMPCVLLRLCDEGTAPGEVGSGLMGGRLLSGPVLRGCGKSSQSGGVGAAWQGSVTVSLALPSLPGQGPTVHGADRSRRPGCPTGKNFPGGSARQMGDLGRESHLQVFEQETFFFFF